MNSKRCSIFWKPWPVTGHIATAYIKIQYDWNLLARSSGISRLLRSTKEERFQIFWVAYYHVGSLCTQANADPCFFVPWFTFSAPFWMTSQFRCARHSASCFAVCRTCWKVQALAFCRAKKVTIKGKLAYCERCKMTQKLSDCGVQWSFKIVVHT